MKFLIVYQEMSLTKVIVDYEQEYILKQLAPAFENELLEDVIFLSSYKARPHEIIDLADKHGIKDQVNIKGTLSPDGLTWHIPPDDL